MAKVELCGFCKEQLPKHSKQCHYGNFSSADSIKLRLDKKKIIEDFKLENSKTVHKQKGDRNE